MREVLSTLSPGEKAQILKWVVQEFGGAFAGIDARPDVCGGAACIARTRIPVWVLEQARKRARPRALTRMRSRRRFAKRGRLVARFYSDENIPLPVVTELRRLGHDVMTALDAGNANTSVPDPEVLGFAAGEN